MRWPCPTAAPPLLSGHRNPDQARRGKAEPGARDTAEVSTARRVKNLAAVRASTLPNVPDVLCEVMHQWSMWIDVYKGVNIKNAQMCLSTVM